MIRFDQNELDLIFRTPNDCAKFHRYWLKIPTTETTTEEQTLVVLQVSPTIPCATLIFRTKIPNIVYLISKCVDWIGPDHWRTLNQAIHWRGHSLRLKQYCPPKGFRPGALFSQLSAILPPSCDHACLLMASAWFSFPSKQSNVFER